MSDIQPLPLDERLALLRAALNPAPPAPDADAPARRAAPHVLDALSGQPWAIEPGFLATIYLIAQRLNDSPESVATLRGQPLDNTRSVTRHGATALIPVRGPIMRYANLFSEISGATSLEALSKDFQAALDDPAIRRIVLHLDTPGGQTGGIAEFGQLIAAANDAKPVTAYVGDLAASAGYWLASQASEIVLSPTAMVGSIGVVMTHRPAKDAPLEVVSSVSPLKRAKPDTDEGRADWQRIVDQTAAVFVADIAKGRKVSEERVLADFGRGSLLIGAHAVSAGMADRIASLNSLLSPSAGMSPGFTPRRSPLMADATQGAPTIDRAYLNAHHPELVESIRAEAHAIGLTAGRLEGAAAERERIQAVRAQLIPGHEKLIEALAFDGQTTGPEAAVAIIQAEQALAKTRQAAILNAPPPVPAAEASDPDASKQAAAEAAKAARDKLMAQVSGGAQ